MLSGLYKVKAKINGRHLLSDTMTLSQATTHIAETKMFHKGSNPKLIRV